MRNERRPSLPTTSAAAAGQIDFHRGDRCRHRRRPFYGVPERTLKGIGNGIE